VKAAGPSFGSSDQGGSHLDGGGTGVNGPGTHHKNPNGEEGQGAKRTSAGDGILRHAPGFRGPAHFLLDQVMARPRGRKKGKQTLREAHYRRRWGAGGHRRAWTRDRDGPIFSTGDPGPPGSVEDHSPAHRFFIGWGGEGGKKGPPVSEGCDLVGLGPRGTSCRRDGGSRGLFRAG